MTNPDQGAASSLREQRRLELRRRLSDTATRMFLAQGFDAVKVSAIARECGVTEKTVFNHFPTKESLLVDRWTDIIASVRTELSDSSAGLVDAVVTAIRRELDVLTQHGEGTEEHMAGVMRFGALIVSTPALMDHRRRAQQELTDEILACVTRRFEVGPEDPGAEIVAEALAGLFSVFYRSLARHARHGAAGCRQLVASDVDAAARQLVAGIAP